MNDNHEQAAHAAAATPDAPPREGPGGAAARALAEAAERRGAVPPTGPAELHGRGGLEPVRYGDWEVKGLASDF